MLHFIIGVIDVTEIRTNGDKGTLVLNHTQGFQDCAAYAKLEQWLGSKADEYWDENFDTLELRDNSKGYKPDHEWVQCNKCWKWRLLDPSYNSENLSDEWFCYMAPLKGSCSILEQAIEPGVITVGVKRSNKHSVSSSHVNTSDYSGDWYHNPLPSHSQPWYLGIEAPSSSYYPPVTSDLSPYCYLSPYAQDPVSSTTCITSQEDWSLASTSHSPNTDNTSSLYCPIQSDSFNFYTWCQSEHTQEKPFEDKVNTALSEHGHRDSKQHTAGKSTQDISTLSFQKDLESKVYGPPSSQLQQSVELADPKSRQMTSCPANSQAYISTANPMSLGIDSLLNSHSPTFINDFHESRNPTVLSSPAFIEIPSANLHKSDCKSQVNNCKSDRCSSCKMDVDFSRKESTKVEASSASSCKGISVGKTNTQVSSEFVSFHMADNAEKGSFINISQIAACVRLAVAGEVGREVLVFLSPAAKNSHNPKPILDVPDDFYEFTTEDYNRLLSSKKEGDF